MSGGGDHDGDLFDALGIELATTQPDNQPLGTYMQQTPYVHRPSGVVAPQGVGQDPVVVSVGHRPEDLLRRVGSPMTITALVTMFGVLSTIVGFLSTYIFATKTDLVELRREMSEQVQEVERRHDDRIMMLEREIARRGEWMNNADKSLRRIEEASVYTVRELERRRVIRRRPPKPQEKGTP